MLTERLTSDADLDAVVALEAASFTNPWTREMLARELEQPTAARVYVLRLPGVPVAAFCSCWVIRRRAARQHHRRRPARGAGTGSAARSCMPCSPRSRARACSRATLEVRRSNLAAQRLYERLGFAVAGQRRNYYTHPEEDALILWRRERRSAGRPAWPDGRP